MEALKNKNQNKILTPEIRIAAGRLQMHEIDLEFSLKFVSLASNGKCLVFTGKHWYGKLCILKKGKESRWHFCTALKGYQDKI